MAVPSTRTPVRVARGSFANLSTTNALASLQEGEICFATDEQRLYVKQGAGLTPISASSQAALHIFIAVAAASKLLPSSYLPPATST